GGRAGEVRRGKQAAPLPPPAPGDQGASPTAGGEHAVKRELRSRAPGGGWPGHYSLRLTNRSSREPSPGLPAAGRPAEYAPVGDARARARARRVVGAGSTRGAA